MKKMSIRRWIILSFVVILFLSVTVSAVVNYREAYTAAMRDADSHAELLSKIVEQLIDHEWDLEDPGLTVDSASYIGARYALRSLCREFQMDYVSVYTVDPETPSRHYYFFVAREDGEDERLLQENALKTVPTKALQPGEQALLDGNRDIQRSRVKGRYEGEIVWFAPCLDEDGNLQAVIAIDDDSTRVQGRILRNFFVDIIPFSLSLLAGMLIFLLLMQRRVISPVSELSRRLRLFAADSRKKPEPLRLPYHDEIWEMADSFEKMTADISLYINNIEKLTQEKTEIETQMELARRIQNSMVPERTGLSGDAFSLSAMTRPAKAVGGDFYDCFLLDEKKICVVMGDVSGKGVSAALTMAMVKTVIHDRLMSGLSPAETLNRTNDHFCDRNPENLFVTVFIAVLNTENGELCYANAGHTNPVLLKAEPAFLNPEPGIAIGVFEDAGIRDCIIRLSPGQGILLYTDGVTEAVNSGKTFFGEQRLLDALSGFSAREDGAKAVGLSEDDSARKTAAEEAVLCVSRAVAGFCEGCDPFDDMAALALIYRGDLRAPDRDEEGWKPLPVDLGAFDEIRKAVFAAAGDTPATRQALLACDEALANIVSYSGATTMAFFCDRRDDLLRVAFSDNGVPFDPTAYIVKEKEFEELDSGGMGLILIAQSVSDMRYERKNDSNELTLLFPLQPSPSQRQEE